MPQTPLNNLGINYDYDSGDDGWKAGVDNNFVLLDAVGLATVINELNAPPGGPTLSDAYIIGTAPTGAWTGNARGIAVWNASAAAWAIAAPPVEGWKVYDRTLRKFRVFDGVEWQVRDDVVLLAANVTIDRTHYNATIELDTTAAARDVTIPTDVSDNLPIGFHFTVINNSGTNGVTFTTAGLTTRGIVTQAADRDALRVVKVAADTWISS